MRWPRRRYILSLLLLLSLAVAFALSLGLRDTTPPQVYAEVPERLPAALPFTLEVSADEPVTYLVRYAEYEYSEVAQSLSMPLLIEPGEQALEITATDAAYNATSLVYSIYGVPEQSVSVSAPGRLIPGAPFSVSVAWDEGGATVTSVMVSVEGETRRVFRDGNRAVALAGVPLGTPPGTWRIAVALTDEYGRSSNKEHVLEIAEYPQAVQDLNLSSSVLSVVTPEGRQLEAETMAAAYAKQNELAQPLWLEPFMLPIEGRSTSGFGAPRRYAVGGNVSYHYGTDIAAPAGTPIRAANRGRVLVADFYPIKGGFVVLDHGAGVYSLYLHQSRIVAAAGQEVARGEVIGEVGSTGLSTGPHLHWEMRVFGEATDPMTWVDKLLP